MSEIRKDGTPTPFLGATNLQLHRRTPNSNDWILVVFDGEEQAEVRMKSGDFEVRTVPKLTHYFSVSPEVVKELSERLAAELAAEGL